jgi:geranylgeranyl diphosphate synthase type II
MKVELSRFAKLVEKSLLGYVSGRREYPPVIYRAMRYSLFAGGKRLRPILTLMSAKACGLSYSDAMPVACAMEMIHTYSLIHDDLPAMDDDDLRRGKPTSHKKFGEAVAILAGDALLTKAFETALSAAGNKRIKTGDVVSAVMEIADGAGVNGMIGGQVVDILSESKEISKATLLYLHRCKTGALISASVAAGAILAGADKRTTGLFRSFGEKIGLAFQIVDDILDETGDEKKMGKKARKDSGAFKSTYPKHFGLERSKMDAEKLVVEALDILCKIKGDTTGLAEVARYFTRREY